MRLQVYLSLRLLVLLGDGAQVLILQKQFIAGEGNDGPLPNFRSHFNCCNSASP